MRSIEQVKDLKGKKVLVRVDFNVPIKDGKVEDDFRIRKALSTIKYLADLKAKVILISHLGKGGETLAPVAKVLNGFIKKSKFVPEVSGELVAKSVAEMKDGEVLLLENLRNDIGEKECDKIFALNLAKLGDLYVNDAFSVSHREDASIVLLPKILPSYAGFQLVEEIKNLSKVFEKSKHPFLFILGGVKFDTKIPLIEKYLKISDYVFVGGALANNFLKSAGYEVGKSLVDNASHDLSQILKNKKLFLPIDVVVERSGEFVNKKIGEVEKSDVIVDMGADSVSELSELVEKAKLIVWNGPLGKYDSGKSNATKTVLECVADSKAESVLGGGDLISFVENEKDFSFVSTGGGATIEFLAKGTLLGIKALE